MLRSHDEKHEPHAGHDALDRDKQPGIVLYEHLHERVELVGNACAHKNQSKRCIEGAETGNAEDQKKQTNVLPWLNTARQSRGNRARCDTSGWLTSDV